MTDPYALLRALHGYLGVLALAAVLHPALRLRAGRLSRGDLWSLGLSTLVATGGGVAGLVLYPSYRRAVKPGLLLDAPLLATLFETKEHLGFYAVVLVWGGAGLAWAHRPQLARTCFVLATLLMLPIVVLGTWIAAFKTG